VVSRITHWQAPIFLVMAVSQILDHYHVFHGWSWRVVTFATVALFLTAVLGMRYHNHSICLACGHDFPVDAQEQAEGKRRGALRRVHLITDHLVTYAAILIVGATLSYLIWWVISLLWVLLAVQAWDSRWHNALELYCPFCRHDEGADDTSLVPEPVPTGEATR
jgi:hypothetical protein